MIRAAIAAVTAFMMCSFVPAGPAVAQERPSVKVKVFAELAEAPGGFVNPDLKDSLKDVREAIKKKKDWLEQVEAADLADLVVTINDRRIVPTGEYESSSSASTDKSGKYASGTARTREIKNYTVSGSLKIGEYVQDVEGVCRDTYAFGGLWRTAAGDVASQVEKFAKTNYGQIMANKAKRGR